MSTLRRVALRTPILKEFALRQLDAETLRQVIRSGDFPRGTLHALASRAIANPDSPLVFSRVALSAAEFADLAIRSGQLTATDEARLVVIGSRHWDLRLPVETYIKAARIFPDAAGVILAAGGEAVQQEAERALMAGELEDPALAPLRTAITRALAGLDEEEQEARQARLRDRAARILEAEAPVESATEERRQGLRLSP